MEQSTIILYAMIVLVLIGIPVILAKKSGKSPMEMLFGKRGSKGLFGTRNKETGDGASQAGKPQAGKQANSNRNDFMDLISRLATYARRNHFRLIIPGTLSCGGSIAVLTALVITKSRVVGINCFGFGGRVIAAEGDRDWEQIMNGEESSFPSPVKKNRDQEKIVRQVLEEVGFPGTEVEIIGVFTSPSVWLSGTAGTNCYKKDDAMKYLKTDRFMTEGGLDPRRLDEALQPRIVRAKGKKEENREEGET